MCALSLCLTATALPASAEGEEDIDLISDTSEETPVADGEPADGEETAEEATRSETQEEITITAAQVTRYMEKKERL